MASRRPKQASAAAALPAGAAKVTDDEIAAEFAGLGVGSGDADAKTSTTASPHHSAPAPAPSALAASPSDSPSREPAPVSQDTAAPSATGSSALDELL